MTPEPEQQSDALLLPFLQAADEPTSSSAVEELICEFAQPIIKNIIRKKLRVGYYADRDLTDEEAADLFSDVTLKLIGRLRELKSDPSARAIRSFRGYVAVTAYHACDEYLRKKYSKRYRLKNQLRYVLTHRKGFSVWRNDAGGLCCGFAQWKNRKHLMKQAGFSELVDAQTPLSGSTGAKLIAPDLLAAIFNHNSAPLELDDLVSLVAQLWQIKDDPLPPTSIDVDTAASLDQIQSREQLDSRIDQRIQLENLWAEICDLPPRQRVALLLSLRDDHGRGLLNLLPLIGIASVRQIAEMLTMSADKLARFWNRLPLEDAIIADALGVTRQQVVNLRKCARARLLRRIRMLDERTKKASRW
jgi:RNA polymerase sigma factor (sigma-70 family)